MATFPNVDDARKAAVAITDRETKAFFWGFYPSFPSENGLKAWALNTLAEHFRAFAAGLDPVEANWPIDYQEVLADLEKEADDFVKTLVADTTVPGYGPA